MLLRVVYERLYLIALATMFAVMKLANRNLNKLLQILLAIAN